MRPDRLFTLLALAVLALAAVPVGGAVFVLGFMQGDSPCVLCWEQRIGMALVALIGLFVLRYGARPFYLGLAVLVGLWGTYMGLRHSSLHLARDIGQGFSAEIMGAHTYSWSFFIFWVCTAAIAALTMMARQEDLVPAGTPRPLRGLDRTAFIVFLVVIAGNIVQAFASTGPPPFVGQSDPVRFSFNPRHWVWSLGEFEPAPIALRGRWAVEKPDAAPVDPRPASGPLQGVPALSVSGKRTLNLPLRGTPTGLAYDAGTDRFLLTTQTGVYVTSAALDRIEKHTVVDTLFSVDLARFVGAIFLDSHTVMAVSDNKSFVVLEESDGTKRDGLDRNFRYFLESFDDFDEVTRSRFATVRAKMMYVMSAAFDSATNSIFTITVPNRMTKRLVVSRFSRADMTLSEEFTPMFAAGDAFAPRPDAPGLERLYVTGATIADGCLYALSAAHSTLLTIDLASHQIVAAHTIPGLTRPTGLALKGHDLYIVSADGRDALNSPRPHRLCREPSHI
jgi:disulfide bond formation protein DsbB